MRIFLGLALPDALRDALQELQRKCPGGRHVQWENFHLTLAFLGDATERMVDELDLALSAKRLVFPQVTLKGLGEFGGKSPRAIWVAATPEAELEAMHRGLVTSARQSGFDLPRRRFVPHVTLSRFPQKTGDPLAVARFFESRGRIEFPPFQPYALTLFRSHLRPGGPVYEVLAEYPVTPGQTISTGYSS